MEYETRTSKALKGHKKHHNLSTGLSLKVGRGRWDAGTWGLGEVVREDFGTRRRAGIRGHDKQITPDFCAELVIKTLFLSDKYKII